MDERYRSGRYDNLLPSWFYDNPRFPGKNTLKSLRELNLSSYDAETVLINAVADGQELSPTQLRALREIIDGEGGEKRDFLQILRKMEEEEEYE